MREETVRLKVTGGKSLTRHMRKTLQVHVLLTRLRMTLRIDSAIFFIALPLTFLRKVFNVCNRDWSLSKS